MRDLRDDLGYDGLLSARRLTHQVWEVGVLLCLRDGPKRYTDIGKWLGTWSRIRPTDSAITRSTANLVRVGYLERVGSEGGGRALYSLTSSGRRRADLLIELVAFVAERAD